ncbi:Uncharacterised protein [Mycobacteroides abscessus subsp. abscessus]|nr:Uncharacterised protein [Mycobacteroides abscessus subsp. abscessus]
MPFYAVFQLESYNSVVFIESPFSKVRDRLQLIIVSNHSFVHELKGICIVFPFIIGIR